MTAATPFEAAQARLLERYGVEAESRFLDVPAVSESAHVLVVDGEGPPVVMVPGFADPAALWTPLMPHLGGLRLHAVDRPCFGLTGPAEHDSRGIRRLAVDFLEQVLDALGLERPFFVANSIGSLWTFWLALDRPDRVGPMAHVGCPATLLGTSAPLPMRLLSVPLLGRALMRLAPPSDRQVESFARMVGADLSERPAIRALLVAAQKLPGAGAATRDLVGSLVRLRGARPEVTLSGRQLRQIRQPTLLVWGASDAFGPPEIGRDAAARLPRSEFHVIEGGHVPWIDRPEAVAALLRPFLRSRGEC